MKLLIITQKVNKDDAILGFFHRWILEFAKHVEHLTIICLEEGVHELPDNVRVLSLGKESGTSKLTQLARLYKYVWQFRNDYDNVFVHMNQIYVILCGVLWRLLNKKIGLWYAHGAVSNSLRLATMLTHHIFTSTEQGFRLKTKKKIITGQGIDTSHFTSENHTHDTSLLRLVTVGRIGQSKNIETLIRACIELRARSIPFHFTIIGAAVTETEKVYETSMRQLADSTIMEHVTWYGAVSQSELPNILQQSDVFIHDGATQSLDKAPLEAVASGLVVISANKAYKAFAESYTPQLLFDTQDVDALVRCLADVHTKTGAERKQTMHTMLHALRGTHSIEGLISGIVVKY